MQQSWYKLFAIGKKKGYFTGRTKYLLHCISPSVRGICLTLQTYHLLRTLYTWYKFGCHRTITKVDLLEEKVPSSLYVAFYLSCWNKFLTHEQSTLISHCCQFVALSSVAVKSWSLPLRRLLPSLSVVPKHPRCLTSSDVGDEVRLVFGSFLELSADSNVQHVDLIQQNSLARFIRQSDNVVNIENRSSSVFQDSLLHFCHIFGRGSGRSSSRTLFIID